MLSKLTSRKFWVAIVSIIVGVLGVLGADDSLIQMVSSVGLILIPAIVYIITEGRIDAAALNQIDMDAVIEAIKEYFAGSTEGTATETVTTDTATTAETRG